MRSDAALAERFAAGDEAAFDVLYERHRPVVLAVSMGVLGTTQDAEDATQETFSALAVALRSKPPAELRPWLIRVARNASIDTTRRRRHRLLTLDGEIPDVPARPVTAGQAELAVVLDGIRELPEGQRMALLMRELGGHSYSEIADFLETDEEAVKGLIARARVGLRSYREATEMSCATARVTIAAEPDGRRYDKTIRRHLRTCAGCRSYRAALKDDAKALRAALPIQAGAVATGGITTGMLTAAKGTLLGYGLTQAAATCAASACAVGALGGMVFVAPVHRLGVWPILPRVDNDSRAAQHKPAQHKPTHRVTLRTATKPETPAPAVRHFAAATPAVNHSASDRDVVIRHAAGKPDVDRHRVHRVAPAVDRDHRHAPAATHVKLPPLHATHGTGDKPQPVSFSHHHPAPDANLPTANNPAPGANANSPAPGADASSPGANANYYGGHGNPSQAASSYRAASQTQLHGQNGSQGIGNGSDHGNGYGHDHGSGHGDNQGSSGQGSSGQGSSGQGSSGHGGGGSTSSGNSAGSAPSQWQSDGGRHHGGGTGTWTRQATTPTYTPTFTSTLGSTTTDHHGQGAYSWDHQAGGHSGHRGGASSAWGRAGGANTSGRGHGGSSFGRGHGGGSSYSSGQSQGGNGSSYSSGQGQSGSGSSSQSSSWSGQGGSGSSTSSSGQSGSGSSTSSSGQSGSGSSYPSGQSGSGSSSTSGQGGSGSSSQSGTGH